MSRVKAWFITLLPTACTAGLVYSVVLLASAPTVARAAAALACGAVIGLFAKIFFVSTPRTSSNLPLLLGTVTLAAAATVAVPDFEPLPAIIAVVAMLGSYVYVFWYSRLGREPSAALEVGAQLPAFELEDESGKTVSSRDLTGAPTLWLFFRGNWCPLCMAQIREVAAQYRELERRGVKTVLVSPQSHENTKQLAARFDVPFTFLVDPNASAARQLGIAHEGGLPAGLEVIGYDEDTVLPTVFLVDADGHVLFADQTDNYRVRPEPSTFLAVLDGKDPRAEPTAAAPEAARG